MKPNVRSQIDALISFTKRLLTSKDEMCDYGFNTIIKEYAWFPGFLSLPCYWEHGWSPLDEPLNTDLKTHKPLMLVFNERRLKAWRAVSSIPALILGAPFVHYRRMHGISISNDAKGTLAFPSHSCVGVDALYDVERFCNELRRLPDLFHPITICLHDHDVKRGNGKIFTDNGFDVVSAGEQFSPEFPKRFYEILARHRYTTSNVVGSYSFYSIELGLPFFITGEPPRMVNYGEDPNVPKSYRITDFGVGLSAQRLFSTGPIINITDDQSQFVKDELGIEHCVSRWRLWRALVRMKIRETITKVRRRLSPIKKNLKSVFERIYIATHKLDSCNKIFTHMTVQEKISLHRMLLSSFSDRDVVCVEIGSYLGASSCFVASALSENSILYCVDTWGNDAMKYDENDSDAEPRDTFAEFEMNTAAYNKKIRTIRKWSSEAVNDFRAVESEIDFLFVDGDHGYEGVRADWECYSPFLRRGSVVVFHDTGWAEGVNRVIDEFVQREGVKIIDLPNMQGFRIL